MKSLIALYLSACLATGRAIFGRPAGEPVHVLYVDQEMTVDDVQERLESMGFGPDDDLSHLHYLLQTGISPFDTPDGGESLYDIAAFYSAELVVIDTMAEAVEGAENDSDTYRRFTLFAGRRLKAAGITTLHLDHEGLDNPERGPRGSTGKKGYVDVVTRLVKAKDEESVAFTTKYAREPWVPKSVTVLLEQDNGMLRMAVDSSGWMPGVSGVARTSIA